MTAANVRKGRCRYECRSTWRYEHGGSVPGGPFPGTMAGPGDVRLCQHGDVWEYARTYTDGFFNERDAWARLSRFWQPLARRRALAALATADDPLVDPCPRAGDDACTDQTPCDQCRTAAAS